MNFLARTAALGGLVVFLAGGIVVFVGAVIARAASMRLET